MFLHHVGMLPWHDSKHVYAIGHLTTYMIPKPEEINLITGETSSQVSVVLSKIEWNYYGCFL